MQNPRQVSSLVRCQGLLFPSHMVLLTYPSPLGFYSLMENTGLTVFISQSFSDYETTLFSIT